MHAGRPTRTTTSVDQDLGRHDLSLLMFPAGAPPPPRRTGFARRRIRQRRRKDEDAGEAEEGDDEVPRAARRPPHGGLGREGWREGRRKVAGGGLVMAALGRSDLRSLCLAGPGDRICHNIWSYLLLEYNVYG